MHKQPRRLNLAARSLRTTGRSADPDCSYSTKGTVCAALDGRRAFALDHDRKWCDLEAERGNGNGSDVATFVEGAHCYGGDPGNSFNAGNRGGDEVTVTSPGGVSSVPNPGGNNVPPLP